MEKKKNYAFCAMLSRMKYITRWGLMRSTRQENLSEHTAETAVIAHTLALLAAERFGVAEVRPETVAVAALYHDASEILTGDMPTPVKYKDETLKTAYKALEKESAESLAALNPPEIAESLRPLVCGAALNAREARLLKAADCLSALIKCMEEEGSGNTEFRSAKMQQYEKLQALGLPEADFFMEFYLPCYEKDLDELTREL